MQIPRVLGLFVFAGALTFGSTSRADEGPLSDTARELFVKGVKAFEHGQWEQCRAALLAAFAIKPHAQVAGNLADCELKLGKHREAAEHAWFSLRVLRPDAPSERRASIEAMLKEAQAKVGTLRIVVEDAEVLVDGRPVGRAPLAGPVFVEPGRHAIEALRAGDTSARATVEAAAGETREVVLAFKKSEGPAKPIVIGGAATAGVALVAGVVLLGVSAAKAKTASELQDKVRKAGGCVDDSAGDCADLHSAGTARAALGNAGFWTVLAGGTVGVVTLVYGVVGGSKAAPAKAGWQAVPVVTTGGGGLLVKATF